VKLMAIDGNSLLNRAFYAVRQLSNAQGVPTNALYGFLNMFFKLREDLTPDAVCVCFDVKAKTFRHLEYEGYKAQRKPMPEDLAAQMPLVKQVLDLMGIPRMEKEGFEADDLLGTLARMCREDGAECVIVTGDRDSLQFIDQGACVALVTTRMGQTATELYDDAVFRQHYRGLAPARIVDLKAIMGDASDNIPGVKGIGEKGAMDLLERFGTLDNIYANLEDASLTPSMKKKLTEGREMAYLSYRLASGCLEAPVDCRPAQLMPAAQDEGGLYDFLSGLELRSIIKRLELHPAAEKAAAAAFTPRAARQLSDVQQVQALPLEGQEVCCVVSRDLTACALATDSETVIVCAEAVGQAAFDGLLRRLAGGTVRLCLHDAKGLFLTLEQQGITPALPIFDTALAAYLLDPAASGYPLEGLAAQYLGFEAMDARYDAEDAFTLLGISQEALEALAQHADVIRALYPVLRDKLQQDGMLALLQDIELPLMRILAQMQQRGIGIDRQRLEAFGDSLAEGIAKLEQEIYSLAGEPFNIGSPKQLGVVLFEKLGLKATKKTKTGYSTDAEVLEKLRSSHPIIDAILDYRKLTKLKSTYVDGLTKVIADDGRIHSTFHQTVTVTGRLSSADPNLQNIPIRQQLGGEIRRCFVPREGHVFIDADYSQIELRILAHIANDESMLEAFASGEDIHTVTASQVFRVPLEEVTPQLRSRAKAVNFGIVYGISAYSLSEDIGVYPKEAQQYIDAYLEKYTGVRDYMERIKVQAKEQGYVSTLYGRRRMLPELKSGNFNIRAFGERVALNTPIQGTAADIIKLAMIGVSRRLEQEGLQARLLLQVHDELLIEAPERELEQVKRLLQEEMEGAAQLQVRLRADVSWGENWYDAK